MVAKATETSRWISIHSEASSFYLSNWMHN